jgi:hypothetical protein
MHRRNWGMIEGSHQLLLCQKNLTEKWKWEKIDFSLFGAEKTKSLKNLLISYRVARWNNFKRKIPVWLNRYGRCWYI